MTRIAVVPGSFDPLTLGHLDVIGRAARLFDEVRVVVVHNPAKQAFIDASTRVSLVERSVAEAGIAGVTVDAFSDGLLADYCRDIDAAVLVKGVRNQLDLGYEAEMAVLNEHLAGVQTVFVLADPAHAAISSTLVRQVARLGGDVTPYVPGAVAAYLAERNNA